MKYRRSCEEDKETESSMFEGEDEDDDEEDEKDEKDIGSRID